MKSVLALALFAAATSFLARDMVDTVAYRYTETCDRSPLADPVTGYYRPTSPICRLAERYTYGDEPFTPVDVACSIAALAPTDANTTTSVGSFT